jgi:hypothetical protein
LIAQQKKQEELNEKAKVGPA